MSIKVFIVSDPRDQTQRQANPAAADLLRLCSFLSPEAIPEEIFLCSSAGSVTFSWLRS